MDLEQLRVRAAAGDAAACYELGAELSRSEHLDSDPVEGLRWLLLAARTGSSDACFEAARSFRMGRGCAADHRRALELYRSAAELDHTEAQFDLALMLAEGLGLDGPRPDLAEPWYQRAAMAHHGGAAHNLGIQFATGNGVQPDAELALELFEYAVSLGDDHAMFSLGLAHASKEPADLVEAAMWAELSSRHRPEGKGRLLLENVAPRMTAAQLDEARERADGWTRKEKPLAFLVTRGGQG